MGVPVRNILQEVKDNLSDSYNTDAYEEKIRMIQGKIDYIKKELLNSLNASIVIGDSDIDRVTCWHSEAIDIQNEAIGLYKEFERAKFSYAEATDQQANVFNELSDNEANIAILKNLIDVCQNVEKCDWKNDEDFLRASKRLKSASEQLKLLSNEFCEQTEEEQEHKWIKSFADNIDTRLRNVYDYALKRWNEIFQFEKNLLRIRINRDNVASLIETFENTSLFEKFFTKFSDQLWKNLFSKVFSMEYTIKQFDDESQTFTCLQLLRQEQSDTPTAVKYVFENLLKVVNELFEVFNEKPELMGILSENLSIPLATSISINLLPKLISETRGEKESIMKTYDEIMVILEDILAKNFNIERSPFDTFRDEFENLFQEQTRRDLLANVRKFVKFDIFLTFKVVPENSFSESKYSEAEIAAHNQNPFETESYLISDCMNHIRAALEYHLDSYPKDTEIIKNAYDLFISIITIQKQESGCDSIPLRPILVHNNCQYLKILIKEKFNFCEEKIPHLDSKASQSFSSMMKSIRSHLNTLITTAFVKFDENKKDESADRFITIYKELHRIDSIYKDILPKYVWTKTLATLVNHVVNEFTQKILLWDDITAKTAQQLATAFEMFAISSSDFFKGKSTNPREIEALAIKAMSKWQRFRLVTFVLTASLKDIENKWVDGCGPLAMAFSSEEVRRFVRALFQNTDIRAAFLASLK